MLFPMRFQVICVAIILSVASGLFVGTSRCIPRRYLALNMGLGDMLKKALANEDLPPPTNPGLSKEPDYVTVEFLPSKKVDSCSFI